MAEDDWAIVVGIKKYFDPQLAGLEGPENDAKEFHGWVLDPKGGNVPEGQAAAVRIYENYDANWIFGVKGTF